MASAYEIFARAERIELAAAAFYRRLAERFPWSARDLAVLKRLELEEIQHAARVRLLAAQYRNDAKRFQVPTLSIARFDAIEAQGRALSEELESGRWQDDLPGLKTRLVELEALSGASHADVLAEVCDERVGRFFRQLAAQDRQHLALLIGLGT